jgi:hypothetical protein
LILALSAASSVNAMTLNGFVPGYGGGSEMLPFLEREREREREYSDPDPEYTYSYKGEV